MSEGEPAHLWVPPGARGNFGDEVADVAKLMGRPLDYSQRIAVDAMTSYGAGGRWLALETVVKGPRQSVGKTGGIVTPIMFADLFLWDADRIAWTAHLFRTTRDSFTDHCHLIESTPEFDRRIAKISYGNGEEAITLTSGAVLEYLARSKGGGRGLGGKRVVVDEALFFPAMAAGALLPILAARSNAQVTYAASAAKAESDHLRALTRRGRAGGDPSLILVEFCARGSWAEPGCQTEGCTHVVGSIGCALDDVDLWLEGNTGVLAGRVGVDFLAAMRRSLDPLEFGREFLGWDEIPETTIGAKLTPDAWASCEVAQSEIVGEPAFGIAVSWDRAFAAIAVAGRNADGVPQVELAEYHRGTRWVKAARDRLRERYQNAQFGIIPSTAAGSLLTEFEDDDSTVELAAADVVKACGGLVDAVTADPPQLVHLADPTLAGAVAQASTRDRGDGGWIWWQSDSAGDISPLVAATVARHLAVSGPRPLTDAELRDSFG